MDDFEKAVEAYGDARVQNPGKSCQAYMDQVLKLHGAVLDRALAAEAVVFKVRAGLETMKENLLATQREER